MARLQHSVIITDTDKSPLQNPEHECRILLGHILRKRYAISDALVCLNSIKNKSSEVSQTIQILTDALRPDNRLNAVEQQWYERHHRAIASLRLVCPMLSLPEIHVCLCIVDNMNTTEIANELCRSEKTVDHYRQSIRHKLNIKGGKTVLQHYLRAVLKEISIA